VPLRSAHASSVLQAVWHLALSMPRCEARRLMPRKRVTGYRTAIVGNGTSRKVERHDNLLRSPTPHGVGASSFIAR
jgi:hypothetical protein